MSLSRRRVGAAAAIVTAAIVVARCGEGRSAPTAPSGPSGSTPSNRSPVVSTVTLDRTHLEAGREVEIVATVENAEGPDQLRMTWTVEPAAGTWLGNGLRVRWRAPTDAPVPATYTFIVTVVEPYVGVDATGRTVGLEHRVTGSSPPLWVNDWRREMMGHSEAFMAEYFNASVSADASLRNFTDSCAGKRAALAEIVEQRRKYTGADVTYTLDMFLRSIEWPNCTGPTGSATCALLIYKVEWLLTRRADGGEERVQGTESLRGVYERDRWWLCQSQFSPAASARTSTIGGVPAALLQSPASYALKHTSPVMQAGGSGVVGHDPVFVSAQAGVTFRF